MILDAVPGVEERRWSDDPSQAAVPPACPRHPLTGDSPALRNAVIALLGGLLIVILGGIGMLSVDLGKRVWGQWERFIASGELRPPPGEIARHRTDSAPSGDAAAPVPVRLAPAPPGFEGLPAADPISSPATWIRADDYPIEALRRDEEGSVAIFYVVGENGRVERCFVQQSSGSRLLDSHTCALVSSRGLFAPAVDGSGKATKSAGRLRFRWDIAG